jgi:glycosyltransferase involved in cell wall biosynthesis
LAAAIRSVLDHPDQARAMGQAGRQRVCEQFHSGRSAEAIIEGLKAKP